MRSLQLTTATPSDPSGSGTRVTITGRLVADPKLRYSDAGVAWSRMCVALRGTEGTIYQDVLASGLVAEASAKNLRSGNRVRVDGRLRGRRWIGDDGVGCYDIDIVAGSVRVPFRWAMSAVASLTPMHDALGELELSAAMLLLAEQEESSIYEALDRLRRALMTLHEARELAVELAAASGRPVLHVVAGRVSPVSAPGAA